MSGNHEGTGPEPGDKVVDFKAARRKGPALEVVEPVPATAPVGAGEVAGEDGVPVGLPPVLSAPPADPVTAPLAAQPSAEPPAQAPAVAEPEAMVALLSASDVRLSELSDALHLVEGHEDATTLVRRYHEALTGIVEEAQNVHQMLAMLVQALQAEGIDPDELVEGFMADQEGEEEQEEQAPALQQIPCPACKGEWTLAHKMLFGPECPACGGAGVILVDPSASAQSDDVDGEDAGDQE